MNCAYFCLLNVFYEFEFLLITQRVENKFVQLVASVAVKLTVGPNYTRVYFRAHQFLFIEELVMKHGIDTLSARQYPTV